MQYKTHQFGKVIFIEVINSSGLRIIFSPIGAAIKSIQLNDELITVTPKYVKDFLNNSTLGRTIGPYEIENKQYSCPNFIFSSKPTFDDHSFVSSFFFNKKNMIDGKPGNLNIYVTYSIVDDKNELLVDYRVTNDTDNVIHLSNDLLFNMNNFQIIDKGNILLSNDTISIDISQNGYEEIKVINKDIDELEMLEEKNKGLSLIYKDKGNIKNNELYHRSILYKFIKRS